jgi:hypothetical protein
MIKSKIALIITLLFFPLASFAKGFTASVDKNAVSSQDSLDLKLKLEDLQARGEPDFSELEKSFKIIDQQQSSVTNVINGESTANVIWDLTLIPLTGGQLIIPPISVNSSSGELETNPITINVSSLPKANANASTHTLKQHGISFTAVPSQKEIYKNQPFLIQFQLAANQTLRDVSLSDLSVKDAIVEHQGEPKIQTRVASNGREEKSLVVSYLVTPLKDGTLEVPPLVVNAKVEAPRSQSSADNDSPIPELDGSDPFAQMQKQINQQMNQQMNQMMQQFSNGEDTFGMFNPTRSIAVSSRPLELKVLPPVAGVSPWLPAQNLSLSESWSGTARSGEPMTRTILTQATGLASSQLPGFEDQISSNENEKVYPDQPQLTQTVRDGKIYSTRKDVFTIIPEKSGEVRFPAVQLTWWDTINHQKNVTTLPEKIMQVARGSSRLTSTPRLAPVSVTQVADTSPNAQNYLFSVAAVVIASTLILLALSLYLSKKKLSPVLEVPVQEAVFNKTFTHKGDINSCKDVAEVLTFLQNYSESHWELPPHSPLSKIVAQAESRIANFDSEKARRVCQNIEDSLYGNRKTDLQTLRKDVITTLLGKEQKNKIRKTVAHLPELNPS